VHPGDFLDADHVRFRLMGMGEPQRRDQSLEGPFGPISDQDFLEHGRASEANAVFRTKALIGLGSVAAFYQITEGMPGRVTD
jgi:hypothetical protein